VEAALSERPALIPGARPTFAQEITFRELQRLRQIVKRVWMKYFPPELYTDREADRIIESYGPKTREHLLKRAVDNKGFLVE
jgi:hypothetical protein